MVQVSGFTFIKHGIELGYPFLEGILSISQLCDEVIINVGFDDPSCKKDDGTYQLLRDTLGHSKFKFIKSHWDPAVQKQGLILSEQTNIALNRCKGKTCQYIQGDEVVHEDDLQRLHDAHIQLDKSPYDGLIFDYIHFYGNASTFKHTRKTYRNEIRAIKGHKGIKSWKDAQGMRRSDDSKLNAFDSGVRIFHYGWARQEAVMDKKVKSFSKLYHGQDFENEDFNYQRVWGLYPYNGTHPEIMKKWLEENKNDIDFFKLPLSWGLKDLRPMASDIYERLTGHRPGEYKNYIKKTYNESDL